MSVSTYGLDEALIELLDKMYPPPAYGCPECEAEIDFGKGQTVDCPGCGISLRRPRPLSSEQRAVISEFADPTTFAYWQQRAEAEDPTPARLRAEIKYTGRQHVYRTIALRT
jgi:hypothetical protein